jgi:isoaspartyl peptidase/L-asparaginase-like protein (Ntn-hydrolase superfamily)
MGAVSAIGLHLLQHSAAQQASDNFQSPLLLSEGVAQGFTKPIFIATWPFGLAACERSRTELGNSGSILNAVERGINLTELDETVDSVGVGGTPNAEGVVQLDASFMDGVHQRAGSVAGLEGFPNPISVARRVMEVTKHVMLVGQDAARFAKQQKFVPRELLTFQSRERWEKWKAAQRAGTNSADKSHDTIALLGLGSDGHLCGGCSTSGLAFKLPGRVGDSPIIGSGLYVDGEIGAAGATGVGENVLRYCASFLIVEFMRQGKSPTDACEAAIRRIAGGDGKAPQALSVNFVAVNKAGVIGAAGTDKEFVCAVVDANRAVLIQPRLVQ